MSKKGSGWVLRFCCIATMLGVWNADAQSRPPLRAKSEINAFRTSPIMFKADDSFPSLAASPVFEYPLQCSSDGTVFIRMIEPPRFTNSRIYAISPDHQVRQYNQELIGELHDVQLRGYFGSEEEVLLLVFATRDDKKQAATLRLPDGQVKEQTVSAGEHHYFVAVFDRDGTFKKSIGIDDAIEPRQVARFPSGEFLVYGMETESQSARLALLNPDGTILRFLSTPSFSQKTLSDLRHGVPGLPKSFGVVPATQLLLFRENVLVISEGVREPVLEINNAGNIRVVQIRLPDDYVVEGFVPSTKHWYVAAAPSAPIGKFVDSSSNILFEINPEDGAPLRRLEPQNANVGDLACAPDDDFIAFRRDKEGKLTRMMGTVSR